MLNKSKLLRLIMVGRGRLLNGHFIINEIIKFAEALTVGSRNLFRVS